MSVNCAKTCGCPTGPPTTPAPKPRCGTAPDKSADCQQKSGLCGRAEYIRLMNNICPDTCGCVTTQSSQSQGCWDRIPECPKKSYQCFVESYFRLMKRNCERTCNFCGLNEFPKDRKPPADSKPKLG
ncbi:unnamed protein product [Bursaphelenchus xylophilus]|uniref:(pine wood nematode) hypothetical protein n=1 Tax=Bursaphelenchus xylophilus TaxID=6326 RepID=A0A1I7SCX4_BURXY|nr:unnamed protein product [Bursaphelenchus xylophilus]CAG9093301.1 unnamed protein product [Bursaphelenchus xylophilus]